MTENEELSEAEEFQWDPDLPDPLQEAYLDIVQRVAGLPELAMQSAAVKAVREGLDAMETAWCIDPLLRGALWGHPGAPEAMLAMIWWLIQMRLEDEYDRIKDLFVASHQGERFAVTDLVREVPPYRSLPKGRRLPEVRLPMDRDTTLGERRMLAGGPKRKFLDRLLMDPSPLVIEKLMNNPQVRLQDVMTVATRRPTVPEILQVVVLHRRWFGRYDARAAVVQNPFADTGLVLKLLPTMRLKTLRSLVNSGDLHPLIHESAGRLVRLREERTAPWGV